ncbi:MAG: CBS domain-containing protein [Lachnospiraceae bacterium]|nr:CBS domain-containing protein [Lachnospiraceae bacterium]
MDKCEEFLDLYKRLEELAVNEFGAKGDGTAVSQLQRMPEFKNVRSELDYIRDVRNLLTHRPRIDDNYAVEPTDAMIDLLKKTIGRIEKPLIASDIYVPMGKVLYAGMETKVFSVMSAMYKKAYTHVPILDNSKVVGVFSDNTLMNYILFGNLIITKETRFSEIEKYLPLGAHSSETYRFVARNETLSNISDIFDESLKNSDRVGMIFVTEHGKSEEKLLGIITAWDVAAAQF